MNAKQTDTITVAPVDATLGAFVTEVDLRTLSDVHWRAIEAAFHEYAVLVFPGQSLESSDQKAFARRFGTLEQPGPEEQPSYISNVDDQGNPLDPEAHQMKLQQGTLNWHTDSSYLEVSAKASTLSAKVVTKSGGATEWADMRAAYDALDDETKQLVGGLRAHHSLFHSLSLIGYKPDIGNGFVGLKDERAPLRPLVKVHPVTGRPALFLGQHACAIEGMSAEQSKALIDRLMIEACQPPRTYEHHWRVGDVVIWDNRCVLHRARPYDPREPRKLEHVRIAGDPATESAPLSPTLTT
jgi:alpha-ketoglutarate-dependent taurine dioxygenase